MMQAAIAAATTLEEVERLNRLLQSGQVPGGQVPGGRDELHNGTMQRTAGNYTLVQ